jgi:RNA polymerase subunit RPABC4/transcription elongation factor Spt4
MKKKECPACAMNIEVNSTQCPICGYEFATTGTAKVWVKWLAIALLLIILLTWIF